MPTFRTAMMTKISSMSDRETTQNLAWYLNSNVNFFSITSTLNCYYFYYDNKIYVTVTCRKNRLGRFELLPAHGASGRRRRQRNRHWCALKGVRPSGAVNCWPTVPYTRYSRLAGAAGPSRTSSHRVRDTQRQCVCRAIFLQCDFLHQWFFLATISGLLSKNFDLL